MTKKAMFWFGLMFLAIISLWWFFPSIITKLIPDGSTDNWGRRGTFGDSFGMLTSLFSALAFGGVAVTLYLQSTQLERLNAQEQSNAKAQALQVRLLATTALLNLYTSQDNLLQERLARMTDEDGLLAMAKPGWGQTIHKARPIRKKQAALMAELERLMAEHGAEQSDSKLGESIETDQQG